MSDQIEGKEIGHEEAADTPVDAVTEAKEDAASVDAAVDDTLEAVADVSEGEVLEEVAREAEAVEEEIIEAAAETIAEVDAEAGAVVDAIQAEAEAVVEGAVEAEAEIVEAAAEAVAEVEAEAEALVEAGAVDAAEAAEAADAVEAEILEEAEAAVDAVEVAAAETVAELAEEAEAVVEAAEEIETEVAAEALTAVEAVEEAAAEIEAEAAAETDEGEEPETKVVTDEDGTERVVRVLAVGMAVDGVVKRTTDFGAFVDIGVGRDGLVHISELSVRRVAKVTDVLTTGQKVTAWIKQLDRERNRISLTLISPDTKTIRDLNKDDLVNGTVTRIVPYGAFIDIGVGRDALLHIREMAEGYIKRPEDVVQVGEELEARIIELSKRRGRIDLSIKGLRPEPEAAEPLQDAAPEIDEEELHDPFADVEVLSPMELAFQRAMADDTEDVAGVRKKRGKRGQREDIRAIQDEIINRTLEGRE